MKYAAAIRFGGELVSADECDYNSYKHFGLLCPECKDPVFLRAGGERARGETVYQVGAHFSHFAAKDPALAAQCEKRVSQYGVAELAKRAAIARNQRLKLMQRHLWNIFCGCYRQIGLEGVRYFVSHEYEDGLIHNLKVFGPKGKIPFLDVITDVFCSTDLKQINEDVKRVLLIFKDGRYLACSSMIPPKNMGWESCPGYALEHKTQRFFLEQLDNKLDWRLHQLICLEVVTFLKNAKSRELVKSILTLASVLTFEKIALGATHEEIPEPYEIAFRKDGKLCIDVRRLSKADAMGWVYKSLVDHLVIWLSCFPWASEFDRIRQQESKAA